MNPRDILAAASVLLAVSTTSIAAEKEPTSFRGLWFGPHSQAQLYFKTMQACQNAGKHVLERSYEVTNTNCQSSLLPLPAGDEPIQVVYWSVHGSLTSSLPTMNACRDAIKEIAVRGGPVVEITCVDADRNSMMSYISKSAQLFNLGDQD